MNYPLAGIKVLDFTRVLAGPFASRTLSDLGADVLKIEPPEGDMTRLLGRKVGDISGYFNQQNAGKRSVCVDLFKPGARELILKLAEQADIVMENYRPNVMAEFGLAWEDLSAVNPKLVMLSISGFGQVGPERMRASYAPIIHAETGLLARQAAVDGTEPHDYSLSIADTYTSLHGLVGMLSALHYAQKTGIGQHVDLAMINAMMYTDDYLYAALEGTRYAAGGGQIFNAPGGPLMLAGDEKWWWRVLNTKGGVADPTPEGADLPTKIACRKQAIEGFMQSFASREELIAKLDELNLAWGNVNNFDSTLFDKQASIGPRGIITEVDDRQGGTRKITQTPYKFSAAEAGVRAGAPFRGEHNYDALEDWAALSKTEIDKLHTEGILLQGEDAARLNG